MKRATALAVAVCLSAACGRDGAGTWRSQLVPVPEPDLARHEASTRAKVTEARVLVEREIASRQATRATAAAAFGELGRICLAHDLWSSAQASLANASALAPDDRRWPYLLGVIAQLEGRLDAAAKHLERALQLGPGDGPTLIRLGQVDLDRDLRPSSRQRYEQALGSPAMAPAARFGLGRIAAAEGNLPGAATQFEQVLAAQPGATVVHNSLGLVLRRLGRRDEAQRHLALAGRAAVTFPDPLVDDLSDLVTSARSYVARGAKAQQEGNVEQALREYRLAVQADPGLALAQYSLGTLLGEKGDIAQAIVHLQRATELEVSKPEAFFNLATALLRQGRLDEGLAALDRVLVLEPGHQAARLRRAAARRDKNQPELARADLEAILARDPLHAEAIGTLAVLLAQTGQGQKADQLLRDTLARHPPAPVVAKVHFTRAFLDGEKGNLPAAIEGYRRAVAVQPDYGEARFNLAVSLLVARRHAEAAEAFTEAVRLQPSNVRAHLALAKAWMGAGQWAKARAALEHGLQRLPGDLSISSALAEVLAGSPDPAVRDGVRALQLAQTAYEANHGADHAEAVGMALAELGRFEEAVRWQRDLVGQAESGGAPPVVRARLSANLARYERGEPVRISPR